MKVEYLQKKKLPDTPGVYFFLSKSKRPLYIGKATSLRDRVRSYFSKDLIETRGPLLVKMVEEAHSIEFKTTDSVLEALILEADLIKKWKPEYNTKEKDDKSFNCVVITKEDFPQILLIRKKDLNFEDCKYGERSLKAIYGPFTNGMQLRDALKIIRKIFPYRDEKCFPKGSAKNKNGRACFSRQVGLCPGVCTGEISKEEYRKTINHLELFFEGKKSRLIKSLEREMKEYANVGEFERAAGVRETLHALTHIRDIALIKKDIVLEGGFYIEAYDVAHLSGKNMVGVCVSIVDGMSDKKNYKKFNIRTVSSTNDVGALKEILSRRFAHDEWRFPELVAVDGSTAQMNAAKEVLASRNISIPVVAVVKDDKHKARGILGDESIVRLHKSAIILANSEAHRFAIAFHKKKRGKSFLP